MAAAATVGVVGSVADEASEENAAADEGRVEECDTPRHTNRTARRAVTTADGGIEEDRTVQQYSLLLSAIDTRSLYMFIRAMCPSQPSARSISTHSSSCSSPTAQ